MCPASLRLQDNTIIRALNVYWIDTCLIEATANSDCFRRHVYIFLLTSFQLVPHSNTAVDHSTDAETADWAPGPHSMATRRSPNIFVGYNAVPPNGIRTRGNGDTVPFAQVGLQRTCGNAKSMVSWLSGKSLKLLPQMSYFKAKMYQIRYRPGLRSRAPGEAYSAPQSPSWIQGPTSKGREEKKDGREEQGKGRG